MTDHEQDIEAQLARYRALTSPVAFSEGFADRVMARIEAPRPLADALQRAFVRMVPLAAAAVLLVGVMNVRGAVTTNASFVDRVLGLPTMTLANAYALEGDLASWGGVTQ